jgi:hypothetical protein
MKRNDSLIYKFFDVNLLLYSWSFIKCQIKNSRVEFYRVRPISRLWFYKASFLIKNGLFNYANFQNFKKLDKKTVFSSLNLVKYRVLEIAFLFFFTPFFLCLFSKDDYCENIVCFSS